MVVFSVMGSPVRVPVGEEVSPKRTDVINDGSIVCLLSLCSVQSRISLLNNW